jgi:hypothetical protein
VAELKTKPTPARVDSFLAGVPEARRWHDCAAVDIACLIRAGADLDFRTPLGLSTLSMALLIGRYDAAEALIDAGARPSPAAATKLLAGKKDDPRLAALVKRVRSK